MIYDIKLYMLQLAIDVIFHFHEDVWRLYFVL